MNEKILLKNATGRFESEWLLGCAWSFACGTLAERRGRRRGVVYERSPGQEAAYVYMTPGGTVVAELLKQEKT